MGQRSEARRVELAGPIVDRLEAPHAPQMEQQRRLQVLPERRDAERLRRDRVGVDRRHVAERDALLALDGRERERLDRVVDALDDRVARLEEREAAGEERSAAAGPAPGDEVDARTGSEQRLGRVRVARDAARLARLIDEA